MSREPIPQEIAAKLMLAAIAGDSPSSSFLELRPLDPPGAQEFVPVRELDSAVNRIGALSERHQTYVGAAPREREAGTADAVAAVWALWADCDSPESVQNLRAFRPWPSVVVRSGSPGRLHGWWPLRRSITPLWAERANRRLAYRLKADPAVVDRARVMRPILSVNRKVSPAVTVECVRLELDVFELRDVVGSLPDPPTGVARARHQADYRQTNDGALAGLARVVREGPKGERNNRLNWAAFRAGEHIAAGTLTADECERELLAAALEVGLPEAEALRTIHSGLSATGRRAA